MSICFDASRLRMPWTKLEVKENYIGASASYSALGFKDLPNKSARQQSYVDVSVTWPFNLKSYPDEKYAYVVGSTKLIDDNIAEGYLVKIDNPWKGTPGIDLESYRGAIGNVYVNSGRNFQCRDSFTLDMHEFPNPYMKCKYIDIGGEFEFSFNLSSYYSSELPVFFDAILEEVLTMRVKCTSLAGKN